MYCPNCGTEWECGCSSCKNHRKKDGKPEPKYVFKIIGKSDRCGKCGLKMPLEWWEDIEFDIIKQEVNKQSLAKKRNKAKKKNKVSKGNK